MGEYAHYRGEQIKIGTCESMYYLRADQIHLLDKPSRSKGDTDVMECINELRFRFPFPDEDKGEPGSFENYGRAIYISGLTVPEGVEHYNVQFSAQAGYLLSLPCPEGAPEVKPGLDTVANGIRVARNGFLGAVGISQQRLWKGKLVTVAQCGGCGTKWRYETLAEVQPVLDAINEKAKREDHSEWVSGRSQAGGIKPSSRGNWYREIAARIVAGYTEPLPWERVTATA